MLVGALIAIAGGVVFRMLEASHQRRQWLRDQLRSAAEQFVADANAFHRAAVIWADSEEEVFARAWSGADERLDALRLDVARLRLVAPQLVSDGADLVMGCLDEFDDKVRRIRPGSPPSEDPDKRAAAEAAGRQARREIDRFVGVVRGALAK